MGEGIKAGGRRSREGSRCVVTEGDLGVSAGRVAQAVDAVDSAGHGKSQGLPGFPGAPAMEGFGAAMP